ncbi:response regulator [Halohasta salina]|uniref:response regulator n=1 Tax=Halohasta salina TaxID=2961621 RepID=UPI0020A34A4F|nr:response regulator [Halohasta salina]
MSDRALVVDDSSFQRTIVSNTIEEWFEIVATAENGKEAIDQFKEERPDVITMDIMMPEMDGITAVKNIKEISPETIIVMVTSVKQKQKMREAARAGADGYVTKPVNTEKLREEFADVLDWPAASQQK